MNWSITEKNLPESVARGKRPTASITRAADVKDSLAGKTRRKYTNLRWGEALAASAARAGWAAAGLQLGTHNHTELWMRNGLPSIFFDLCQLKLRVDLLTLIKYRTPCVLWAYGKTLVSKKSDGIAKIISVSDS